MTEAQSKHLKRLNGFYQKSFQEEDWKAAKQISTEIEAFISKVELIEKMESQKKLSPLN